MQDVNNFEQLLSTEEDVNETISLLYSSYDNLEVPYDVWLRNAEFVEKGLENVIFTAPHKDKYPLEYLKLEELDDDGVVVSVYLQVYGKKTLVRESLIMVNDFYMAEYFASNYLNSNLEESIRSMLPENMTSELGNIKSGSKRKDKEIMPTLLPNYFIDDVN